jgi:hypothetical protein
VQGAASAVPLDSLFIDEDFGTLDPETLETLASAIEALPLDRRRGNYHLYGRACGTAAARVVVDKQNRGYPSEVNRQVSLQ